MALVFQEQVHDKNFVSSGSWITRWLKSGGIDHEKASPTRDPRKVLAIKSGLQAKQSLIC